MFKKGKVQKMKQKYFYGAIAAALLFTTPVQAGDNSERGNLDTLVPEAKDFKVVYSLNPAAPVVTDDGKGITYAIDKSKELAGPVKRIAYFLSLTKKDGGNDYIFVSMDAFTQDLGKIGVPTKNSGSRYQTMIDNMTVKSNVAGIASGDFATGGNIEFWDCNYSQSNAAKIPNADSSKFDFGDRVETGKSPGYGSMQVHNYAQKQTLFAFNNWVAGNKCDLGIGNSSGAQPDWTFSSSAQNYTDGVLLVLIESGTPPPPKPAFQATEQAPAPEEPVLARVPIKTSPEQVVPEAKNLKLVYSLDPTAPKPTDGNLGITYTVDKSKEITGKIKRIAYFLALAKKDGGEDYIFVSTDAFTQDIGKIGVPTQKSGAFFQDKLSNVTVKSNVAGIENGTFADGCNIEFWCCDYGKENKNNVPNAEADKYDTGDTAGDPAAAGYGSMQLHNNAKKQTLFAFNNWRSGSKCDLGIGNNPAGEPDWTFRGNGGSYAGGVLQVMVETE